MKHIFRAYDIRGVWNKDIDGPACLDIGMGLGLFLKEDLGFSNAVVGYDIRTTSPLFHGALSAGLLSSGIDVLSVGRSAFGVTMMAGWKEGADCSCYITASHLGPEWNGLKMYFGDGVGFPEEYISKIGDRVIRRDLSGSSWDEVGKFSEKKYLTSYIDFWKERYLPVLGNKGLSVGVDCGGGAMCLSARQTLGSCGTSVTSLNGEVDPTFSGRGSEPKPEKLGELRDAVIDGSLDFGVAFDGDGDRAVVVDDTGRFLSTDRLGIIIARSLIKEKMGGLVLANVESSMAIEDVLQPLGAGVKRIKVGHTFLTLEAREEKAIFGVERSGHLIVPEHVLFDDAIVAPLEILRILAKENRSLSEIADTVPQYPAYADAFECEDDIKFDVLRSMTGYLSDKYENVNTMDGIRIDTDEGWVLIRCSNTSPVIRMTVEARDEKALERLKRDFSSILKDRIESFMNSDGRT